MDLPQDQILGNYLLWPKRRMFGPLGKKRGEKSVGKEMGWREKRPRKNEKARYNPSNAYPSIGLNHNSLPWGSTVSKFVNIWKAKGI